MKRKKYIHSILLIIGIAAYMDLAAQMITGVWSGRINRQKVEVKIIQRGDSLTGTSYYYENPTHYRRYSIKGYLDQGTNEAVWWDDQLVEDKTGRSLSNLGKYPLLSRTDFNCPGEGIMKLDGKAGRPEEDKPKGDVHLDKSATGIFPDEWDFVIDNYLAGANDPEIIDSVSAIAYQKEPVNTPVAIAPVEQPREPAAVIASPVAKEEKANTPPSSIEEKFNSRKKVFVREIPVSGDSIELRFYDNAEIDGDSISLFLNDKLIFQHIRLQGSAYTIKLAVNDLQDTNELAMVAENLGSIPPNTSYMIAEVNHQRYDARLESTEGSSAMIRFVKKPATQ